jgi:hypothetical protein
MLGTNGVMALLPGIEKQEQAVIDYHDLPGKAERIDHAVVQNHCTAGHSAS